MPLHSLPAGFPPALPVALLRFGVSRDRAVTECTVDCPAEILSSFCKLSTLIRIAKGCIQILDTQAISKIKFEFPALVCGTQASRLVTVGLATLQASEI
jgi:hypothetical protein